MPDTSDNALELYYVNPPGNVQFVFYGTGTAYIDWSFTNTFYPNQIQTVGLSLTTPNSPFRGGFPSTCTVKIYTDGNPGTKITNLRTNGNGGPVLKEVRKFGINIENINFYTAINITYVAPSIPSTLTNLSNLFYSGSTSSYSTFTDASNSLASWDVSNVTNMSGMFKNAASFNKDLSWNTINVTSMDGMFYEARAFNGTISNWDTRNVNTMNSMFGSASSMIFNKDISNWNTSKVTDMTNLFLRDASFNSGGAAGVSGSFNWDVSQVTGMQNMFYNCSSFNRNISTWQTSKVTHMGAMFYNAKVFNQDISGWDVSNVRNMNSMFAGDVTTFPVFNQNISRWVTTNVTDMTSMFQRCSSFNSGGSSTFNWDVQNVTSMYFMFYFCVAFNQDISGWVVSKVTNMSNMFASAAVFNRNLSNWNVSKVTDFASMFNGATAFNNGAAALTTNTAPLTWTLNTSGALKTINMTNMFNGANKFSQDISSWNIKNVSTMTTMFTLNTTSMTKDLFNAMLTKWGVTDPSVNVPKTPFTFSTIKYTSGGSAGLTALRAAPYSWTVTANLVTYTPTSVFSGSTFNLNYSVASTPPVTGRSYTLVNTNSPSTVLSTYVANSGDASYNFTGVSISSVGYASFMIIDTTINAIVDVVQVNGRFPCLKEGTKILTNKGYVPIEDLRKGDLVKTAINDYKAVYMIGKTEIYNHALPERETHQLYKCTPENYPEVFEDLILTGCHSILVDEFASDEQREKTREVNGDLYVTRVNYGHIMGGKYRLPACADERAVVYEKEGPFTIYHIALENSNYYHNYGIYANGLLVETCSQRYLNELSHMDSVE